MILAHDVTGTGPDLLLLHAGVADRRMWDPVVDALATHFRVLRCDLRGYGGSPLPAEPYTDADDLDALLEAVGTPRTIVLGNSHGGAVALGLATLHPDRVRALVLLAPAHHGVAPDDELEAFDAAEETLLDAGDIDGAVALNVDTWLGPAADGTTRSALAAMQRHVFEVQGAAEAAAAARETDPGEAREVEVRPELITAPTVVVTGGADLAHFRRVGEHLATVMPAADHVVLDRAGHLPTLEDPDAATVVLLEVLSRVHRAATA